MMRKIHYFCIAATILVTCFIGHAQGTETDVKRSWDKAQIYLPNASKPVTLNQVTGDRVYPVALYMHSCSGIGDTDFDNHGWAQLLARQGFLVVMPDSVARNDRKPSCDPKTMKRGLFPPGHAMR